MVAIALSVAMLATAAAFSQTLDPVTVKNLFEEDRADLKPSPQFNDAIRKAKISGNQGCYPPRATFTIVIPAGDSGRHTTGTYDELFLDTLGKARQEALMTTLPAVGLDREQFKTEIVLSNVDEVRVSYGKFAGEADDEPPKIRVKSVPAEGSIVQRDSAITVTITASERYDDGHRKWPTGVALIQLTDMSGFDPSESYGRIPEPCRRTTFSRIYTVPHDPPAIVELTAIADDGSNRDSRLLRFPTRKGWRGSLDWNAHQLASGPQEWSGHIDLLVVDNGDGTLTGSLSGNQNQALALPRCHATTTGSFTGVKATGSVDSSQVITLNITPPNSLWWPPKTSCREGGSADTGGPVFDWPQFKQLLLRLTRSPDGSYVYDRQLPIPQGTVQYRLILRPNVAPAAGGGGRS